MFTMNNLVQPETVEEAYKILMEKKFIHITDHYKICFSRGYFPCRIFDLKVRPLIEHPPPSGFDHGHIGIGGQQAQCRIGRAVVINGKVLYKPPIIRHEVGNDSLLIPANRIQMNNWLFHGMTVALSCYTANF